MSTNTTTYAGRIAAEIRRRRLARKLSVADAAAAAGVAAQTWYHYEQGARMPLRRLPAIAAALGCSPAVLLPRS